MNEIERLTSIKLSLISAIDDVNDLLEKVAEKKYRQLGDAVIVYPYVEPMIQPKQKPQTFTTAYYGCFPPD